MSWGDKLRRDIEVYSVGPVEDLTICKETKTGHNDDDDQPDGPDRKVGHMHNTLITESDVTSSMMGEMYRQLASAQLREDSIKQGIEEQKLLLKRYKMGTTGQNAAITAGRGVSAVATGTTCTTGARYITIKNPT